MIKGIIFDCFGVLYPQASGEFFERHKNLFDSDPAILNKLNLQIDLGEINRAEFYHGLQEVSGIPADKIMADVDQQLSFDPHLIEFIRKLKPAYKIGLLSNAGEEEIEIIYRDKIDGLFDAIAVSYEVKSVKPNPEIFLVCAKRLGLEASECVFVDDSVANIEAARKLTMETILYPNFGTIPPNLEMLLRP